MRLPYFDVHLRVLPDVPPSRDRPRGKRKRSVPVAFIQSIERPVNTPPSLFLKRAREQAWAGEQAMIEAQRRRGKDAFMEANIAGGANCATTNGVGHAELNQL